ncbi:Acidic mammalian chitinase [Dufourea novaeangliae]|uniref:chitinase n=1 Tax=Dufourea novaeangliae TaxID=178035 RepID=A0A154PTT4_DUFNO|nr:Acidic mammalian chitinase [Dufourea novaeangliae]
MQRLLVHIVTQKIRNKWIHSFTESLDKPHSLNWLFTELDERTERTAKFSPQNINPYLCTHLIYAFGGFTKDNALKPFDKYQDIEKGGYAKFTGLKTYNKNLKTLLAIGGWNEGSSRFSPMVADPARRREFVKNSIKFLRKNHFDGLDLDWEYPAFRDGGKPRDKDNYADLVQELREEFDRESSKTGRPRLLLSLAMPAGIEYIDKGYDVPRLNEYLDFINLLSYDYHSSYEPAVNHHSPLYPLEEDNEYNYDSELTIDYTINYLVTKGASTDKIILGIPTYGRSYTLFNEDATDLGSPADGPGIEGDATREKGYLAYYEICDSLGQSEDWEVIQPNPKAMGPYAFKGDQWVGYDDEDIVRLKARYANDKNLGGIMFWTIDNDDFRGKCHDRPYPLIEAAKETLLSDNAPKFRTFARPKASREEEEEDKEVERRSYDQSSNEDDDSDGGNAVRTPEKNDRSREKSRPKQRSSSSRNRRKQTRRKGAENSESEEEPSSNKLTTPEPPTTPDPGTDFKCEDEGFFSHPRDCKKYFWCLDSGPGGLGVVAHQFTCPSGLVFNKAADSCDYPRNVICPKTKTSQSSASTTRAPITAATSRTTYLYSSTRKPTTEKPEVEEEYEEENRPSTTTTSTTEPPTTTTRSEKHEESVKIIGTEDEEDPKVIKELIKLIKKAGGIEELEKQLFLQNKSTDQVRSSNEPATPATISRTLYERVLNRQTSKTTSRSSTSGNTNYANGPGGAQFEGLDEVPEVKSLRRSQKPQYVTIERPRPSTKEPPLEEDDIEEEDEDLDEDIADVASSEERTISNPFQTSSTQRATPNYINIRRARPSTTTSRNENDVVRDEEEEEDEQPVRSRRPSVPTSSSEDTRDQSPASEDNPPTTKSRYVNIQRFRSTTARPPPEVVSEIVSTSPESTTEPSTSSKAPKIEDSIEVTTTPMSTTTFVSTTIAFTTPNTISHDPETEKSISSTMPESSSTAESVKLVEDSATEILFTTAPASLSTLPAPNTRTSTATVSQPRPFAFNRRNRPTTEATTTVSNPLSASNDQTRPKVSISSRNPTRTSFLVGRGRSRPRQGSTSPRNVPVKESETPRVTTEETGSSRPGRSRHRGPSRYTPPSFKTKTEEPSNSLVRERARTTEETSTEPSRRRFRRPSSRAVTDHPRANELEDSPIVRITQGYPKRTPSRSRSAVTEEEENHKITNIKVFKKPAAVNRDIYARTKYTRKRNNLDETSKEEESTSRLSYPTTNASTVSTAIHLDNILNDASKSQSATGEPRANSIDETDSPSIHSTTMEAQDGTTVNSVVETNTVVTTTSRSHDFDSNIVKIVFNGNDTDSTSQENRNATVPRRRKVLLRKRPVTSTTLASREEEEENKLIPRKRKVIRRIRPLQNSTTITDLPSTEDQIVLRFTSTTAQNEQANSPTTRLLDNNSSTRFPTSTEETSRTDYTLVNDYTRSSFETSTETLLDEDSVDPDAATMTSTLIDNLTVPTTDKDEPVTETNEPPTSPIFLIRFIDTDNILGETSTSITQPETVPTVALQSTTPSLVSSTSNRRLEPYNKTYYLDSRYVRKKFVRRRPIDTVANVSDRYPTRTSIRVTSTTQRSNLEGLSKRRKSLFVRRRPVSSTTTRTTQLLEEEEEEEEDLELEEEDVSETLPPSNNPGNDDAIFSVNLSTKSNSEEFWNRYTTPSLSLNNESSLTLQEESYDGEVISTGSEETYRSTPSNNRKPEYRPRYKVPDSLRKTISIEGTGPLDSSPDETEESNGSKPRSQNFRQPRTRYGNPEEVGEDTVPDATQSPSFDSSMQIRTRFYSRRPVPSSTEPPVTETLIPAKKFDYVADAHRRQQSLRTTPRGLNDDTTTVEIQNLVDTDYTTIPSIQPLVTRLVTSVEESATTERQKILIKTKYSSLTSTTRIPVQTTTASVPNTLEKSKDSFSGTNEDESANEIQKGHVERSTLPIESEFLHRTAARLTTESQESSTIEIESVFSNLIADKEASQLPTLKELIGGRTNDRATDRSPVYLNLLVKHTNLVLEGDDAPESSSFSYEPEQRSSRNQANREPNDRDAWILAKERVNRFELIDQKETNAYYDVENIADNEEDTSFASKKRIDREDSSTTTPRPTTMRGAPPVRLVRNHTPRGFYVTRSNTELPPTGKTENDAFTVESTTLFTEEDKVERNNESLTVITTVAGLRNGTDESLVDNGTEGSTTPSVREKSTVITLTKKDTEASTVTTNSEISSPAISSTVPSSTPTAPVLETSITESTTVPVTELEPSVTTNSSNDYSSASTGSTPKVITTEETLTNILYSSPTSQPNISTETDETTTLKGSRSDTEESITVNQVVGQETNITNQDQSSTTLPSTTLIAFTEVTNRRRQKINSVHEYGHRANRRRGRPSVEDQENSVKWVERPQQQPRRRVHVYRGRQRRPVAFPRSNTIPEDQGDPGVTKVVVNPNSSTETSSNGRKELETKVEDRVGVEGNISRGESEVNSTRNTVSRTPGSQPPNRLRNPTTFTATQSQNHSPNTIVTTRNNGPIDGNEKLDATDVVPETPRPEKDIDQSSRAQELAVTLTHPPSPPSSVTGRPSLRDALRRRISTTLAPRTETTTGRTVNGYTTAPRNRQKPKTKDKAQQNTTTRPRRPSVIDYDYYEDEDERVVGKSTFNGKLYLTSKGTIRCLDQGNFAHPSSCRKFITCAKMVNGLVIGAEYTCPDKLSFDPVGGICNWSAGLGCSE